MVFQTHYDVLANGALVFYSDTIPNSVGAGLTSKPGDLCINTATTSGQPYAWRCTAAGSPGTWEVAGTASMYIATESGANNAIVGALAGVSLAVGMEVVVKLAHSLQAGGNTFAFNGATATAIKSSRNVANNIGVAYANTGVIRLLWDGTEWLDMSQ